MFKKTIYPCIFCIIAVLQACVSAGTGFRADPVSVSGKTTESSKKQVEILGESLFIHHGFSRETLSHQYEHITIQDILEISLKGNTGVKIIAGFEKGHTEIHSITTNKRVIIKKNKETYIVTVAFPGPGSYTLSIWGMPRESNSAFMLTYFIDVKTGISLADFKERQGPEEIRIIDEDMFTSLGFSRNTLSHKFLHVQAQNLLEITFKAGPGEDITAELVDLVMGGTHHLFLERIILENNKGSCRLWVSFPKPGAFRLTISGLDKATYEYKHLFYYDITAEKGMSLEDFYTLFPGKSTEAEKKGTAEWHIITRKTEMESFEISVHSYFEKKWEKMARYYINKSLIYLPALEKYMGITFPTDEIIIVFDEVTDHAFMMYYGIHLAKHHMTKKMPSVLFHEFNHFYFGCPSPWFTEGVNSFLPAAIIEAGYMDKEEGAYSNIFTIWGFKHTNTKDDAPVIDETLRMRAYHFFYTKTFKVHYMICRELGKENYRKFVQDVYHYSYSSDEDIEEFIIKLLKKYKKRDWKKFLTGWVYEGDYTEYSFKDFMDLNKNGIPDIEDAYKEKETEQE